MAEIDLNSSTLAVCVSSSEFMTLLFRLFEYFLLWIEGMYRLYIYGDVSSYCRLLFLLSTVKLVV